jgi:hypothetical protein
MKNTIQSFAQGRRLIPFSANDRCYHRVLPMPFVSISYPIRIRLIISSLCKTANFVPSAFRIELEILISSLAINKIKFSGHAGRWIQKTVYRRVKPIRRAIIRRRMPGNI